VRDYFKKNVCPDTKAAYYFSKTSENYFAKLHWQTRNASNKF